LLQAVAAVDETTLQQGMAQLVDAEIVSQRGLPPRSHYVFKHALIQETAYHSLLKSTRQQHHQRTAQVLAERFPAIADTQPEVLAQHYTEAGCAQQATDYWQRAGQRANARSAYREAIAHCTKGLEVLQMLPETPARAQHELRLCLTLGTSLIATQGYGAVDVEHVYSRARALCAQGGDPTHRIQVLIGLFVFYELRGAIRIAQEVAHELLTLAQQQPEPVFLLRACATGGQAFWLRGDLATARRIFEQGIALYDPQHHSPRVLGTWQDAGVTCLSYLASTLWLLGYPDQAQARSHQALTLSDTLAHPFTRVWAAYPAAQLFRFLQDYPQAHAHIEHVRTLETTHGFTQFAIQRTLHQGWALLTAGKTTEGMAQLHEGLRAYRAKGTAMHLPAYLARLAEAYHRQGQSEEGLAVLTEALTLVDTTDERWWEAELHRLQGEFLLQRTAPDTQQAERCFQHAIEVARHQQGKALELRAAMSLSRLWQQQGKCTEAHTLLAPLYGWFTEGFDTADLQEAKMLLEELSR
jgi:predicted ATPase